MSGGPGGGIPECVGETYSGFIAPTLGSAFDTGQTLNISWYGGLLTQTTELTAIFDVVLSHYNSNSTSDPLWEKTLFSSKAFVFESNRTDRDGVWTNFDLCGNTAFYQLWTISSDLDFSSSFFVLTAQNITTDKENSTYTSGYFVIREDDASTSTGSPSPNSTTSLSSPTTSSSPNPHPGLSTGAKAGIGVGSALAAIVLLLLGFWIYRKRRTDGGKGAADSEGRQKAELDGQTTVRCPAGEADGAQIFEADAGDEAFTTKQKQKTSPSESPVELPTERFDREV